MEMMNTDEWYHGAGRMDAFAVPVKGMNSLSR